MKTMTVGAFKAKFSEVIAQVKNGEEISVTFGKKEQIVGYFKPETKEKQNQRKERILDPLKHLG